MESPGEDRSGPGYPRRLPHFKSCARFGPRAVGDKPPSSIVCPNPFYCKFSDEGHVALGHPRRQCPSSCHVRAIRKRPASRHSRKSCTTCWYGTCTARRRCPRSRSKAKSGKLVKWLFGATAWLGRGNRPMRSKQGNTPRILASRADTTFMGAGALETTADRQAMSAVGQEPRCDEERHA